MSESADNLIARVNQARRGHEMASELLSEAKGKVVTLYRAIGEAELQDVLRYGDYDLNPHGGGKYFALDEAGARRFASTSINNGLRMTITSIQVPESILEQGDRIYDPGGGGASIHFSDAELPDIYRSSNPVEILDAPWVTPIGGNAGENSGPSFKPRFEPPTPSGNLHAELPAAQVTNAIENTGENAHFRGTLRGAGRALGPAGALLDAYSLKEAYDADGGTIGENVQSTAGGIAGGWAGAAAGAAIGSAVLPGLGTVIGGAIGGIAGSSAGSKIAEGIGNLFD